MSDYFYFLIDHCTKVVDEIDALFGEKVRKET